MQFMSRIRGAFLLVVLGFLIGGFFWLTDPTIGIAARLMTPDVNRIDAMNQSMPGTVIGLFGSGLAVIVGLCNIWRRPA